MPHEAPTPPTTLVRQARTTPVDPEPADLPSTDPITRFAEFPLREVARHALDRYGDLDWTLWVDGPWCRAGCGAEQTRVQGWKLHVSATPLSAPLVLHGAARVLAAHRCTFKFARDLVEVGRLTARHADRAQAGKFLTVYPSDDDQLRELAHALDTATAGLAGPRILSDRPYLPGSLVHYRYGAISGITALNNDGSYESYIRTPNGDLTVDRRDPWFSPPDWAARPLDDADPPQRPRGEGAHQVLLNGRYAVRGAITQSARGGVYRATDRRNDVQVVIKQARPYIGTRTSCTPSGDALRREQRNLAALHDIAAHPIEVFDAGGDTFLAQEALTGTTLTAWVADQLAAVRADRGLPVDQVLDMTDRLVDLLRATHSRGLVYRDFTPNNVMVGTDGRLRLIDPELATPPGVPVDPGYTPGFVAPEAVTGGAQPLTVQATADLYSLGSVLFYLCTGALVQFADDAASEEPGDRRCPRTHRERLVRLISIASIDNAALRRLTPAILGLTRRDPGLRWSLDDVHDRLRGDTGQATNGRTRAVAVVAPVTCDRLIDDGLAYLIDTMDPTGEWLWTAGPFGMMTDPRNVQHGAAGVLGVLTRASEALGRPRLRDAVARAATWLDRRIDMDRVLPGLYFGRSGAAWALLDAAVHLGEETMAAHAAEVALRIPIRWPNPDICHGAAGAGMTQLHIWQMTGRTEFLARAEQCADGLLAAAVRSEDGVFWPVPEDFDSGLAGIWYYGFAHGVAGVGAFLLAAAGATGRQDLLDIAREAGNTLLTAADDGPAGARWRADHRDPADSALLYHWCSGSSGIGTFLVRLARALDTAGERYLTGAQRAAVAVHQSRWSASTVACHGLAGNAEFLLDLAETDDRYLGWAEDLIASMTVRDVIRGGRVLLPDETQAAVTPEYGTGLSGQLAVLLRLRHGGPRPWMVDGAAR